MRHGSPNSVKRAGMTYSGERTAGPDRATLAAFVTFVTLAGGNVVSVRYVSCDGCELDPFWAAASRFLLAAVILTGIAFAVRAGMPRGRALFGVPLASLLSLFAVAVCFAETGIVVKAFPRVHPV